MERFGGVEWWTTVGEGRVYWRSMLMLLLMVVVLL
jgi:hypothetical protein